MEIFRVKDLGTDKKIGNGFRTTQKKLGTAIKQFLEKNPVDPPVDPPADEGVGNDDSPSANHIPIPSSVNSRIYRGHRLYRLYRFWPV
ncbi:hypothetical protein BDZ89DRAFT_303715 [Hymenopellis radicata]|nr:hypothetical protein BDZ89DRAFT_303715 [Hymenopellis radicata]